MEEFMKKVIFLILFFVLLSCSDEKTNDVDNYQAVDDEQNDDSDTTLNSYSYNEESTNLGKSITKSAVSCDERIFSQ